jgi:hypothetical protein
VDDDAFAAGTPEAELEHHGSALVIEAGGSEHRLNDGFKKWDPLLRRILAERHGRRVVEDEADAWRAEA